jgi:hypothetical protein
MRRTTIQKLLIGLIFMAVSATGYAAYHHAGEYDSGNFLAAYPDKIGTKLDSCALCHSGGSYVVNQTPPKTVTLGSCQWCHYITGYDPKSKNFDQTLNGYGSDYYAAGRTVAALQAIEGRDSDGDGQSNKAEIAALRYPGDNNDDPSKVPAPFRVFSRKQLECLPQHTQFLLLNATKSTDSYSEFAGVAMDDLLKAAGMLPAATGITVFAPDGFSQVHPLFPDPDPALYHVFGEYPQAVYYYHPTADIDKNKTGGWCAYSPLGAVFTEGQLIDNEDGLKLMLAVYRDGKYLSTGVLNKENKLDGEGPFRVIPPQKNPGPPDQRSTNSDPSLPWPHNPNGDHNAGYSSRTTTIIRVEPLPAGTTDIDTLEAGWPYVDEENPKIVVYGAIDPLPTILSKMDALLATLKSSSSKSFKNPIYRKILLIEVGLAKQLAKYGKHKAALKLLSNSVLEHADGCSTAEGQPDKDDWVTDCNLQKKVYWDLHELIVLFGIIV